MATSETLTLRQKLGLAITTVATIPLVASCATGILHPEIKGPPSHPELYFACLAISLITIFSTAISIIFKRP